MHPLARLAALGVVLLTLAAAGVVVLYGLGLLDRPATGVGPSPTPSRSVPATASPTPAMARRSPGTAAILAQIEGQVRALRGLPAPDIGPPDVITRAELADELERILDETWTAEELERANRVLEALGLLGPGEDLRELSERLYAGQVLGFYDFTEQRMVVVSEAGLDPLARVTYAHEYTHAMQDAAFDTFTAREGLSDDDAILARQALEEGDATAVMFQWAFEHMAPEDMVGLGATPLPDMTGIPDWMIRQLELPYLAGFTFVTSLQAQGAGDWAMVDAAYRDPPRSMEQVLEPQKYIAGEEPVEVVAADVASALGERWQDLEPNTLGQAMIDIWLVELGVAQDVARRAATGWGGDRLAVATDEGGAWAMAWRIAWDTGADAEEFAAAHADVDPGAPISSRLERPSARETVVLHASTPQLADELAEALSD